MKSNFPVPIAQRPEPERIYLFVQHFGRRLREIDGSVGLTPARFSTLASLHFHDARNVSDLAAEERVKRPSMTRLVRDMERDGLLRRARDPNDGRGVLIKLTAKGASVFKETRETKIALVADYLRTLSPDTRMAIKIAFAALDDLAVPPSSVS